MANEKSEILKLSNEFLWNWFSMPNSKEQENFAYAIQPYIDRAEYEKDVQLLSQMNTSSKSQDKFLMIHAAKVERTEKSIIGMK
jgi:hypothetical protein